MAKTNFQYEKRQKELEKKKKAEEKARRKLEAKTIRSRPMAAKVTSLKRTMPTSTPMLTPIRPPKATLPPSRSNSPFLMAGAVLPHRYRLVLFPRYKLGRWPMASCSCVLAMAASARACR